MKLVGLLSDILYLLLFKKSNNNKTMPVAELKLNVGINLYRPSSKHTCGLWSGTSASTPTWEVKQRSSTPQTLLDRIYWDVWYLYWNGTNISHKLGNVAGYSGSSIYSGKIPAVNIGDTHYEIPADLHGQFFFRPSTLPANPTIGYITFMPQSDFAASTIQMDAGVYGYGDLGISDMTRFSWLCGAVRSMEQRHKWESLVEYPQSGDPNYQRYLFYNLPTMPGYLTPGRTMYLENAYNDSPPFSGNSASTSRKFLQLPGSGIYNYEHLTQLMNSQAELDYAGNSGAQFKCFDYEFDGGTDYEDNLKYHRYNILNVKPSNNFVVSDSPLFFDYHFPYKQHVNLTGDEAPWHNTGNYDVANCFCLNVLTAVTIGGTYTVIVFLSNGHCVGDVINASLVPTDLFTYGGLCVVNQYASSQYGPGGYTMNAGEWFNFKLCPSLWHLAPSWDFLYQGNQMKLRNVDPIISILPPHTPYAGSWSFDIARMGFGDLQAARFNAC